jgi:hypothetical protein
MLQLPARITVDDDLVRSRLTVFFRLLLALPHIVWLYLWGSVATVLYLVVVPVAVINGALPGWAHGFYGAYTRYLLHLSAYLTLAANPYPGFVGAPGSYPVDAEFGPPGPQGRWSMAFRWLLAVPALLLAAAMGAVTVWGTIGILVVIPFLAWFACLARGRIPQGFRDALVYGLGYTTQAYAYLWLLSPRYPSADIAAVEVAEAPEHPVRLTVADDLARSRLTVFFRLLLALPHLVWLTLWAVVAEIAALIGWVAALFSGRMPDALHRFISAYVRYQVHVNAFLYLAANPFPGFTGAPGTYPIEAELPPRQRQPRPLIFFRLFLALPAFLVAAALGSAAGAAALLGWFAVLFTGRMPRGLRNLLAWWLRYGAQTYGYALLLTPRYPYSGPGPLERDEARPEPAIEPTPEAVA